MIVNTPTKKFCSLCGLEKSASEYTKDNSKRDGLKFCCNACLKSYKPRKERRDLSELHKTCIICKRELHSTRFLFSMSTEDKLDERCTTCRSWKKKKKPPTTDVVLAHEDLTKSIILASIRGLKERYPSKGFDDLLKMHRSEFEQLFILLFEKEVEMEKWKMPVWVNKTSHPGFMDKFIY